jgi:hypothetical protein
MHANLKKLAGAAAIAATLGLSAVGVGAGVANADTAAPSVPDQGSAPVTLVDWHGGGHGGHGWGGHGDWGRGDWGRGGWGDHGGWGWGWGDRDGWGWGR